MSSRYQRRMTASERWEDEEMGIDSADYWTRQTQQEQAEREYNASDTGRKTNLEAEIAKAERIAYACETTYKASERTLEMGREMRARAQDMQEQLAAL